LSISTFINQRPPFASTSKASPPKFELLSIPRRRINKRELGLLMLRVGIQDIEPIQNTAPAPNHRVLLVGFLTTGVAITSEHFSPCYRRFDRCRVDEVGSSTPRQKPGEIRTLVITFDVLDFMLWFDKRDSSNTRRPCIP
jgi:hypothetical protein